MFWWNDSLGFGYYDKHVFRLTKWLKFPREDRLFQNLFWRSKREMKNGLLQRSKRLRRWRRRMLLTGSWFSTGLSSIAKSMRLRYHHITDFCLCKLRFLVGFIIIWCVWFYAVIQDKELIQLKREARLKGGFYVNPEAKMLFIIRIRGYVLLFFFLVILICITLIAILLFICYWVFFFCFETFSINAMDPKSKKILQLLRLRQVICLGM